jgi:chemotaxis protein CheX
MLSIFDVSTYDAPIAQIAQDVFQTMLDYPVSPSEEESAKKTDAVTAAIFLAGTWQGAVILECSQAQAFVFTARLMKITEPTGMDDDVRDALGEIINMIGGNMKSILPTGVSLSIPSVLDGADYAYRICGANRKLTTTFRGELGLFRITLVQMNEEVRPRSFSHR